MTVVVPYKSPGNDTSLKYALRSAEAYLPMITGLMIVGDRPKGFKDFMYIHAIDDKKIIYRERNIYQKTLQAVQHPQVTEDFIWFCDDYFLLTMHNMIPDYYSSHFGGNGKYKYTVRNTNYDKNFDIHAPIVFNKARFINTVAALDWSKPYGYCIKTEYCKTKEENNFFLYADLKIGKPMPSEMISMLVNGRNWFSCNDKAMTVSLTRVLAELYKKPSRWER